MEGALLPCSSSFHAYNRGWPTVSTQFTFVNLWMNESKYQCNDCALISLELSMFNPLLKEGGREGTISMHLIYGH